MTTDAGTGVLELPVPEGYERHENREIARCYAALKELSRRRLDGPDAEKRVHALLRRFERPHQAIEDRKERIIREHPAPEAWESESLPIAVQETRAALINDLMRETQDLKRIPKGIYLTTRDLPKPIKGELGDQNKFGVADIRHNLGFLFDVADDEEADGTRAEE